MMNRKSDAGQTLPILAFGLFTFLAAAGLAVDMGYQRWEKRLMQTAADSAALTAATDYNLGNAAGQATADAYTVTQANGFQNGVNNVTVTVAYPTVNANYPGDSIVGQQAVQVVVQQVLPTFFMQIFGTPTYTVNATGTATIGTSEGCMFAMQLPAAGGTGITFMGAAPGINSPNCGVVSNGGLNGNGNIYSPSIGYYGPDAFAGTFTNATAQQMAVPAADPLAYLNNNPPPAGPCVTLPNPIAGPMTLGPGVYCAIVIGNGGAVTFNDGLYVLNGTMGFQITGNGTATGGNVTFYNYGSGGFNFTGTGNISLTASNAAVSTLPPGILFFQDNLNPAPSDVSEAGSGNVVLNGTLYFPFSSVTIGGSLTTMNTPVDALNITINGGTVNADTTSPTLPGGSLMQNVSLVQ